MSGAHHLCNVSTLSRSTLRTRGGHSSTEGTYDSARETGKIDGKSEWTLRNAAIAKELLLSYHDAFVLEPDELRCTSAIKHEICLSDDEPFKEHFRCIPPPLLEEVHASLRGWYHLA